jgi:uncharacterized protein YcaQ
MSAQELPTKQVRKLVLNSQRLHQKSSFGHGVDAVVAAIEHLSYVQIDTISVVERAHHHTLWNRVNGYQASLLDQAITQKQAFEYWSHAAAYMPMRDFRFTLPKKQALAAGGKHWYAKDPKQSKYVLDKIRDEGPLQASDFKQARSLKSGGWGGQKPAKRALERLFMEGELMISHRQGFQKVFDLSERVVPDFIDVRCPSQNESLDHLILSTLQANGLATAAEIAYLRKGMKPLVHKRCLQLLENQQIQTLQYGDKSYYVCADIECSLSIRTSQQSIKILSPFDNLLIQRQRMRDLFDFDYQLECYVPQTKRRYGYFVLPILMGQSFIGRMDAKMNRTRKVLTVKSTFFEMPKTSLKQYHSETFQRSLEKALIEFLEFNGGQSLNLESVVLNGKDVTWLIAP